jgi:hypothetical protein
MKFYTKAAHCAFWIGASAIIAACSSQGQQGALPMTPDAAAGAPARAGAAARADAVARPADLTFQTIDNQKDPTFNQLLGISDSGVISGYFGIGNKDHPNKGYVVVAPYGQNNFADENYPGSVQTQVTCIDNLGNTGGFWVDGKGVNLGFIEWNGVFTSYRNPKTGKGTINQILGLNDAGVAVGFYTDAKGINHAYKVNQATGKFTAITPPGSANVTATAINNAGDIVGFYSAGSQTVGFLKKGGKFSTFTFPNSINTQPFGVNSADAIVGFYVDKDNATHGFLLESPLSKAKFTKIDDPNGIGNTTINGINNSGKMVGFYEDGKGNTHGMLITP